MGPYTTQMMAAMGADVVKVEAPGGDIIRHIGDGRHPGMGPIFLAANHGKRSIALDLKDPGARDVVLALVTRADVFVTNMRPAALGRLGLTHDALREDHPRLVHCTLPGFGSAGPYRDHAAYDDVIQAISGTAAVQGGDGEPAYIKSSIADKIVGLVALGAINAALVQQATTGRGQAVEVPMFEAMAAFTLLELQGGHVFDPPRGPTGYARVASPNRRPYRTQDGHIAVMIYTDKQWLAFFDLIGRPELGDDPRFRTIRERTENIDELYGLLAEALPSRTSTAWLEDFQRLGVAAVPVLGIDELLADPHLEAVGLMQEIEHPTEGRLRLARMAPSFSATEPVPLRPAPRLGEHSLEVLGELGLAPDAIDALVARGAVVVPELSRPPRA
ncbi:CoA transferase [Baekduia soli]|uniref:CoA transferase n=2 Tax=Baekduia soli TaxID=496014 RepID=A0A5B8UD73_9ACTN|nr:CoA transferase [Baekduia soli]